MLSVVLLQNNRLACLTRASRNWKRKPPRGLESHGKISLAARNRSAPKLWMDPYLAAFAICRRLPGGNHRQGLWAVCRP